MAESIAELITEDIEETLQTVQRVSGYHFDFRVERADKFHVPADSKCVLDMDSPERDENTAIGHETWFLNYTITVFIGTSDAWEQTVAERMALAVADIHKALMADPHRNAYALNTKIGAPRYSTDAGDMPAVEVPVQVHYRHLYGRPNEL